jgi:hypothetical protein
MRRFDPAGAVRDDEHVCSRQIDGAACRSGATDHASLRPTRRLRVSGRRTRSRSDRELLRAVGRPPHARRDGSRNGERRHGAPREQARAVTGDRGSAIEPAVANAGPRGRPTALRAHRNGRLVRLRRTRNQPRIRLRDEPGPATPCPPTDEKAPSVLDTKRIRSGRTSRRQLAAPDRRMRAPFWRDRSPVHWCICVPTRVGDAKVEAASRSGSYGVARSRHVRAHVCSMRIGSSRAASCSCAST